MTFNEFTAIALAFVVDHPEMLFGKALVKALEWHNAELLSGLPDISKINNGLDPAIFAWFFELGQKW